MNAPAELRRSAWIATTSALMVVSAFVAGKAARDAILLTHYSIQALPLFVGLSAAMSLPVIVVAGRAMARYGPARLVPALNAASGFITIAEWLMIASYPRTIAVVVYFHLSTASAVLVSGFWSIVNERFDIHTAKRRIGQIGMGATIGGVLGGVIAERTAVYFERDTILIVIAAVQLLAAAMLYWFCRGDEPRTVSAVDPGASGPWSALGAVARSRLLRSLGMIVVLTAVAAGALDYVFKADIVAGTHHGLLRELALFYTATNVITAIVQIALCSPMIARLGVPRSVTTLPVAITGFGLLALLFRVPASATVARGAELVTRNSVYRAGYELLYAPLPTDQKRPTKVVLDVGADKLGDILAAQVVGAIVYLVADVRTGLLISAVAVGAACVVVALRMPRSYTKALEESLLTVAPELPPAREPQGPEPWITLTGMPSMGHPADVVPLRVRRPERIAPAAIAGDPDRVAALIRELRSRDAARIKRACAEPIPLEAMPAAIELVGERDELAREAVRMLRASARGCTGMLVDTLLDRTRDLKLRRRLPAIIGRGDPRLAAWGLWCSLGDPSFELRCQASVVLSQLAADGHVNFLSHDDVFACVRRELVVDRDVWAAQRCAHDVVFDDDGAEARSDSSLEHVFRVLGLALPAEPLQIALRAVQTDDAGIRGMALEYLETILPADLHAQLSPLLVSSEASSVGALDHLAAAPRSPEALLAHLDQSYRSFVDKLTPHRSGGSRER